MSSFIPFPRPVILEVVDLACRTLSVWAKRPIVKTGIAQKLRGPRVGHRWAMENRAVCL